MSLILDELHHRALTVPVQELTWKCVNERGIRLWVRRDDLIDVHQSGNKFYKLFYNLQAVRQTAHQQVLSFGGGYSNHLHALASAGYELGISTIGVVRGERPLQLSPTLKDAENWGMKLHFISRASYRSKDNPLGDDGLLASMRSIYGDFFVVPEGGANLAAIRGAAVMGWAIQTQMQGAYTDVCLACGTGTTMAGVIAGLPPSKTVTGFSVLKGEGDMGSQIAKGIQGLVNEKTYQDSESGLAKWRLISGYHGGGYARKLPEKLRDFWSNFEAETGLMLDPVYTLKMFWGISKLVQQNYWPPGSRIVAVHSGGLQGRRGFQSQADFEL